ncbi:MAG: DUF1326 domain-containing protein [Acidobacteria bacterium]|nr:DUF1326 domain-containing protein [Acidobacteriota bacterium]
MKIAPLVVALSLVALPVLGSDRAPVLTGDYVEVRTAEVFTGGCIMNSEAETLGREAVMAWRVDQGTFGGVPLDGLTVVAALAGDRNLGMREMGGEAPTRVRTAIVVDERATLPQRAALVDFARTMTDGLLGEIVSVDVAPVVFTRHGSLVDVAAGAATLTVETNVPHDVSCGAMLWFSPLGTTAGTKVGLTKTHAYWGDALGKRWRQAGKKSAFVGTFAY